MPAQTATLPHLDQLIRRLRDITSEIGNANASTATSASTAAALLASESLLHIRYYLSAISQCPQRDLSHPLSGRR
jgi:hypothetical protein